MKEFHIMTFLLLILFFAVSGRANPVTGYAWEGDGTQHVIYIGEGYHIYELMTSACSGQWQYNDLTTAATGTQLSGSGPSGYAWETDGTQHVIFIGIDNHVYELMTILGSGSWGTADLTAMTGAPTAAAYPFSPSGYAWKSDGTQHVVYRGSDQHIYELMSVLGSGNWGYKDLTSYTDAPEADSQPFGYAWEKDNTQHIVYSGKGRIYELITHKGSGDWGNNDLTTATNAPPGYGPVGYAWEKDGSQHVVYKGTDKRIYELKTSLGSGNWVLTDLTKEANAPPADSSPSGYAWEKDNTQHVVYKGIDQHIYELMNPMGSSKWHLADLTAVTGAPLAATGPVGYVWEADGTQHIVYVGAYRHIYELVTKLGSGSWHLADLTTATGAPASLTAY